MRRFADLTGRRFGRLVAMWPAGIQINHIMWLCLCSDGNLTLARSSSLLCGSRVSCGCLKIAKNKARSRHGMHRSAEYKSFWSARERCTNPNNTHYKYYGARGIEFRFKSFDEFFAEVGKRPTLRHTIERKNNNGHYEHGNVRWATMLEQAANRRPPAKRGPMPQIAEGRRKAREAREKASTDKS